MGASRPTARAHGPCTAQEEGVDGGNLHEPSVNHLIGWTHNLCMSAGLCHLSVTCDWSFHLQLRVPRISVGSSLPTSRMEGTLSERGGKGKEHHTHRTLLSGVWSKLA